MPLYICGSLILLIKGVQKKPGRLKLWNALNPKRGDLRRWNFTNLINRLVKFQHPMSPTFGLREFTNLGRPFFLNTLFLLSNTVYAVLLRIHLCHNLRTFWGKIALAQTLLEEKKIHVCSLIYLVFTQKPFSYRYDSFQLWSLFDIFITSEVILLIPWRPTNNAIPTIE